MLGLGRRSLDLFEVAGQLSNGNAAFIQAAAVATRTVVFLAFLLAAGFVIASQQLCHGQLILVSHDLFLFQSLVGPAQNDALTQRPRADFQLLDFQGSHGCLGHQSAGNDLVRSVRTYTF